MEELDADNLAALLGGLQSPGVGDKDDGDFDSLDFALPVNPDDVFALLEGKLTDESLRDGGEMRARALPSVDSTAATAANTPLQAGQRTDAGVAAAKNSVDEALRETRMELLFSARPIASSTARPTKFSSKTPQPVIAAAAESDVGVANAVFSECDAVSIYASCFEEDFCGDDSENEGRLADRTKPLRNESPQKRHIRQRQMPSNRVLDSQTKVQATGVTDQQDADDIPEKHEKQDGMYERLMQFIESRPTTTASLLSYIFVAFPFLVFGAPMYHIGKNAGSLYGQAKEKVANMPSLFECTIESANAYVANHVNEAIEKSRLEVERVWFPLNPSSRVAVSLVGLVSLPFVCIFILPLLSMVVCYVLIGLWVGKFGALMWEGATQSRRGSG